MKKKKAKAKGWGAVVSGFFRPADRLETREVSYPYEGRRFYFRVPEDAKYITPAVEDKQLYLIVKGKQIKPFKVEKIDIKYK